jgi:hypothetical protein
MAFTVTFGTTNSEKRALTKSVSTVVSVTGTLRNESSVINPSILVQASAGTLAGCNYMEIPTFNRKYFITDVVAVSDKLSMVSGHCDVLSTYASQIRQNQAILSRSANNWNLYLNDSSFKVTNKTRVNCLKFPDEFTKESSIIMVAVCQGSTTPPTP